MKIKEFTSLAKRLLPGLPGFVVKGPMMFIAPVAPVLRGLCFEGSDFDRTAFYVWAFVQPLCVPARHVNFTLGKRVRGKHGERWKADAPDLVQELAFAITHEAMPLLEAVQRPQDVAEAAAILTAREFNNCRIQEAIAYGFARGGDLQQAEIALAHVIELIDRETQPFAWQQDVRRLAEVLKNEIHNDPSAAHRRLESWEVETIKHLGLD